MIIRFCFLQDRETETFALLFSSSVGFLLELIQCFKLGDYTHRKFKICRLLKNQEVWPTIHWIRIEFFKWDRGHPTQDHPPHPTVNIWSSHTYHLSIRMLPEDGLEMFPWSLCCQILSKLLVLCLTISLSLKWR